MADDYSVGSGDYGYQYYSGSASVASHQSAASGEPFNGFASERAATAICELKEYWIVKGIMLQKGYEEHTSDEKLQHIVNYLNRHTELVKHKFWSKMLPEDKLELCRYMTIVDGRPLQVMVNGSKETAEICIVFSGKPIACETDENGNMIERIRKKGRVLGAVQLFEDPEMIRSPDYTHAGSASLTTDLGSVLRIPFSAFYKYIYLKRKPVVKKIIPVNNRDEDLLTDEQIAVMSEADKQVFALRKLARSLIPARVFKHMLKSELIGSRFGDKGSSFINVTEFGRAITLSEAPPPQEGVNAPAFSATSLLQLLGGGSDGTADSESVGSPFPLPPYMYTSPAGMTHSVSGYGLVYIILKGQIQLRLSTSQQRAGRKAGRLSMGLSADGEENLEVKANDIPVMQLESGAWLTVNKDLLTVGQQEIGKLTSRPPSGVHPPRAGGSGGANFNNVATTAQALNNNSSSNVAMKKSLSVREPSPNTRNNNQILSPINESPRDSLMVQSTKMFPLNSNSKAESSTGSSALASPTPAINNTATNSNGQGGHHHNSHLHKTKRPHLNRALQAAYELEQQKLQKKLEENALFSYKLYFQFAHESTYLVIPYSQFIAAMKESKSTETNKQIQHCLDKTTASVRNRIEEFLPLIGNSVIFEKRDGLRSSLDDAHSRAHEMANLDAHKEWQKYDALANKYLSMSTDKVLEGLENRDALCGTFVEPMDEPLTDRSSMHSKHSKNSASVKQGNRQLAQSNRSQRSGSTGRGSHVDKDKKALTPRTLQLGVGVAGERGGRNSNGALPHTFSQSVTLNSESLQRESTLTSGGLLQASQSLGGPSMMSLQESFVLGETSN